MAERIKLTQHSRHLTLGACFSYFNIHLSRLG